MLKYFDLEAWTLVGFMGNILFTSRFIVQWLSSEKAGRTVVPIAFWYLSIAGAMTSLIYFIGRQDLPGVLGYIFALIPYSRNIILTRRHAKAAAVGVGGIKLTEPTEEAK